MNTFVVDSYIMSLNCSDVDLCDHQVKLFYLCFQADFGQYERSGPDGGHQAVPEREAALGIQTPWRGGLWGASHHSEGEYPALPLSLNLNLALIGYEELDFMD